MKKLLSIYAFLSLLLVSACQKSDKDYNQSTFNNNSDAIFSIPDIGSGSSGSIDPNYCKECGESPDDSYGCYPMDENNTLTCGPLNQGDVCNIMIINDKLAESESELELELNFPYEVRDSFMINFAKGQDYITYYYWIGKIMNDSNAITTSNLIDHYNFANEVYSFANTLIYGASNSYPVTLSFKNNATTMISYYKTVCTATAFHDMLDIIQSDINDCYGKTKSQIYSMY